MKQINPDWLEAVRANVNACPYFQLQSMEVRDLGWGTSRVEIPVQPKHMQPFGIVHGGVCASLLDASGFWAAYSMLPEGHGMTTVEIKINYLAPSDSGRLIGLGRALKLGRSLGLAEARIEDETGALVAHGTTTVMALPKLALEGQEGLPPKYLD